MLKKKSSTALVVGLVSVHVGAREPVFGFAIDFQWLI